MWPKHWAGAREKEEGAGSGESMQDVASVIEWCDRIRARPGGAAFWYIEQDGRPWGDRWVIRLEAQVLDVCASLGEEELSETYQLTSSAAARMLTSLTAVPNAAAVPTGQQIFDGVSIQVLIPEDSGLKVVCLTPEQLAYDPESRAWAMEVKACIEELVPKMSSLHKRNFFLYSGSRSDADRPAGECALIDEKQSKPLKIVDMPLPIRVRAALLRAGLNEAGELAEVSRRDLFDRLPGTPESREEVILAVIDAMKELKLLFRE
jgi:hypothetical protein